MTLDWSDIVMFETQSSSAFSHHKTSIDNQDNNSSSENSDKKKVSDTITFGPRFCTLFDLYSRKLEIKIDTSRHLMSLCMDHVIRFIGWVRANEQQLTWVGSTLLDFDYLRPEVRNGIVMILIYTFASIKATRKPGLDMFKTLQDMEQGLGIANKFSLKIYNDPFLYLSFLKTCISALIDADAIPDNERLNQPKNRSKMQDEKKEEITAFEEIRARLVSLLDKGDNVEARNVVLHITSYWQVRGKVSESTAFFLFMPEL